MAKPLPKTVNSPPRPARGRVLPSTPVLLGAIVIGLLAAFQIGRMFHGTPPVAQPVAENSDDELARSVVDPTKRATSWNPGGTMENSSVPRRGSRSSEANEAQLNAADPSGSAAYTRQLVGKLAQLDVSKGALSKERAALVADSLRQIVAQGQAGLPAIREFLERNQDLNFGNLNGAGTAGYASLRAGLIDALQQIGGPDALAIALRTLQTTADPAEVAALARNLEQSAPGQYRDEALAAVRETLEQATKGELGKRDVAPLFQLLQQYGDTSVLGDLEKNFSQWNYYSTMTLAGLPNGEGIPALIKMASDPTIAGGGKGTFALQMLAQVSAQYPDAGTALLEQARAGQISDRAWTRIATGLAGDQYQFVQPASDPNAPVPPVAGLKTYHIESGNQNFYSLPVAAEVSPDEIARRLALVDQLLAGNLSATASQALQDARQNLLKRAK